MTLKSIGRSSEILSKIGYVCRTLDTSGDFVGATVCTQCSVGTETNEDHDRCVPCPPGRCACLTCHIENISRAGGFYQDAAGQNACQFCVPGTYVPLGKSPGISAADCVVCPTGTNTTEFANYRACSCLDNHYRFDRFGQCYMCSPDKGQKCSNDYVSVQPGYWISWNISDNYNSTQLENEYIRFVENLEITSNDYPRDSSTKYKNPFPRIHPCPIPESCNGTDSANGRIRESDMCSRGYEGPLCAVCQSAYYSLFKKCYKCPSTWRTVLQIAGAAVLFVAVMLILYFADNAQNSDTKTLVDHIAAKFKIILGFGQVMSGVLQAVAYIPWPQVLLSFGKSLKIIELNVIAVATPSCLTNSLRLDALETPIFTVSCQAAVICFVWTYYAIRYGLLPKCCESTAATARTLSSARTSCLRNTWWILFVCYPATTAQIVAVLPYKPWTCLDLCLSSDVNQPFCKWYLKADLSLQCDYSDSTLWIVCWSLMIYVIGLPVLMLAGLYFKFKHAKKSTTGLGYDELSEEIQALQPLGLRDNFILSLHFLDENYKSNFWYWEVTEIMRKFLLTCGIQFFGQKSHSDIAIAALLANLFLLLHAQFNPIKRKADHWLQLLSLLVISLNLMLGTLMALLHQDNSLDIDQDVVSVTILSVNGLFVLFILGKRFSN